LTDFAATGSIIEPTIKNQEVPTHGNGSTDKRHSAARVAVVQFNPQVGLENLDCNARAVTERLEQAVSHDADLIVLPELATTGYSFNSRAEAYAHSEKVPTGRTVQAWEAFSKQHDVYIVGCLPELDEVQLFDTAVLVGPDRPARRLSRLAAVPCQWPDSTSLRSNRPDHRDWS
jgi:hypothetical protein